MATQQDRYTQAVSALFDPAATTLVLVARPDTASRTEAARASTELRALGITPTAWVLNQSLTAAHPTDPVLAARADGEHRDIDEAATLTTDSSCCPV